MKNAAILLIIMMQFIQTAAQLPDPEEIMNKSRELSLAGAMSANITLTITEKNGGKRSRTISMSTKSYQDGVEKRYLKFLDPPDVRGTAMLIVDNKNSADEMWIYLPALKKTRRIVSTEKDKSFMNSEFSNADMASPPVSDYVHKHTPESGKNNQFIIESIPADEDKADEYGYSRKVSYIGKENYQVMKMELYNFDNKLFKIIDIKTIHKLPEGRYTISNMIVSNLSTNRKSEIKMSNIVEGAKVDDSIFSLQNLER
jgi:hypothetical protein